LYAGLEPGEIDRIVLEQPVKTFAAGEVVIAEGAANDRIYVVESGELVVWKGPIGASGGMKVAVLQAGDCFGEMSVLRNQPTAASLVAVTDARVRELGSGHLAGTNGAGGGQVALDLARILVDRLTRGTEALQAKHADGMRANARLLSALMMVGRTLVALSFYVFLLPLAAWLKPVLPSDSVISFGVIVGLGVMTWTYQRNSGLPRIDFGLHFGRWPRQVARGIMWTLPLLALVLLGKWIWLQFSSEPMRLFEPERAMNSSLSLSWGQWGLFAAGYAVMSFAQEYVRAVVKGALALFYRTVREDERWKYLLIANLIFAILYVHLSAMFALLSLTAGLLWGWIFQRERSYLAAATSHALTGVWVVFIVSVPYRAGVRRSTW
jgi:CRP-like cAMP-binding protein